jgi:hypothetical protein
MRPTRAASKRQGVSCRAVQNIRECGALSRDQGRPSLAHPSLVDNLLRENAGLGEDANRRRDACSAVRHTGRPRPRPSRPESKAWLLRDRGREEGQRLPCAGRHGKR